MKQYSNPYKILESEDFLVFLDAIGLEKHPQKPRYKSSVGENIFNFGFWGQVGLSGFTAYPKAMNFLENHELSKISKKLLLYQIQQLNNGASISNELCANLGLFAIIGSKLNELEIENQALASVPTFLFRIIKDFSIEKAQISMAKERDIGDRRTLFHCISSALVLLTFYYYEKKHEVLGIRKYVEEILEAYNTTINIHSFLYTPINDTLRTVDVGCLLSLLESSSFLNQYINTISEKNLSNQLKILFQKQGTRFISDAKKYFGGYLFENVLEEHTPYNKAIQEIKNNYFRFICPNYTYLLNTCGKYYDEMMHYNVKMGKWRDLNLYDHKMIFFLAGWLKENRNYDCLNGISKEKLSHDITNYILSYIRNTTC